MKSSVRAHHSITYHGRSGRPKLHWTALGRPYIMVRKSGGGTKRLYLDTKKAKKEISKGYSSLLKEARDRRR